MNGRVVSAALLTWWLHASGNIVVAGTENDASPAVHETSPSDGFVAATPRSLSAQNFGLSRPVTNGGEQRLFDFQLAERASHNGLEPNDGSSHRFMAEHEAVGTERTVTATSQRSTQGLGTTVAARQPVTIRDLGEGPGGGVFKALGVGMFVASGGDLASTELGLSQSGVVEVNPTQQNRAMRIGTHVAVPALMWWVTEKTHNSGKEKLALIMRIGFSVAYSYAVMHNLRTVSSLP